MKNESVNIRPYSETDKEAVLLLLADLQRHIADLDEYGVNKSMTDFNAGEYMKALEEKLQKHTGLIFIAEEKDIVLGLAALTIHDDPLSADHYACKSGYVEELIVSDEARGKGIGNALMEKAEQWFKKHGCRFSRTDCFSANNRAHAFYEKLGYKDRYVNMIKPLS